MVSDRNFVHARNKAEKGIGSGVRPGRGRVSSTACSCTVTLPSDHSSSVVYAPHVRSKRGRIGSKKGAPFESSFQSLQVKRVPRAGERSGICVRERPKCRRPHVDSLTVDEVCTGVDSVEKARTWLPRLPNLRRCLFLCADRSSECRSPKVEELSGCAL